MRSKTINVTFNVSHLSDEAIRALKQAVEVQAEEFAWEDGKCCASAECLGWSETTVEEDRCEAGCDCYSCEPECGAV